MGPAGASGLAAHRLLHLTSAVAAGTCEMGKVAWSRWQNDGYGYWWVTAGGFSVGRYGCGGALLDAAAALGVALCVLEILLEAARRSGGQLVALALHGFLALTLCCLCATDLALHIGAGGARVSLPLVLFVLSETEYIASVVRPWLQVVAASAAVLALAVLGLGAAALRLARRAPASRRLPLSAKLMAACACMLRLWSSRHVADGAGADLLSQLAVDAVAMAGGGLGFAADADEASDLLAQHAVEPAAAAAGALRPPILLFHWEAGSAALLERGLSPANRSATPFLAGLRRREDVLVGKAAVSVPMTLKSAWEALCGVPPALTSDFREHGSALRRGCLPRALRRCCGYWSILAKTDTQLPDLPRRVFGFDEVLVAPTNAGVIAKLHMRLEALGALSGQRPVLVYFYADDAHAPYTADRVSVQERGYEAGPVEDVFLALSRRTDSAAQQLARFWPPPRASGSAEPWRPEHGLAIYFGDHGEILHGSDRPPPHGNSVEPAVTEVLLVAERRAFAPRSAAAHTAVDQSLRRLADVFSTVVDVVGLRADGPLHVGESLLQEGNRSTPRSVFSFTFYRPGDVVAARRQDAGRSGTRALEFRRGTGNWTAGAEADILVQALAHRQQVNALLTASNVHAAWLVARLRAAARRARAVLKALVRAALPAAYAPLNESHAAAELSDSDPRPPGSCRPPA